jgi:hypothetical protein
MSARARVITANTLNNFILWKRHEVFVDGVFIMGFVSKKRALELSQRLNEVLK